MAHHQINYKRSGKLIVFELMASATLTLFLLFFAGVFEYNWTAPFALASATIARASEETALGAQHFSNVVNKTPQPERHFLSLATVEPVTLSNELYTTAPEITAVGALILDRTSNLVLFEKNQHKRWPMASITKLVTASILLDYRDKQRELPQPVEISEADLEEGRNYFEPGDIVAWDDLFKTMLVGSSNTAAQALIRVTGMSEDEWHKAINQKLFFWGLQKTQVREVTGLSVGNISTPYEIAQIFNHALERKEIRDALETERFTLRLVRPQKTVEVETTNLFLLGKIKNEFSEVPIAKTGYIDESGFNMVAKVTGEKGQELVVVVLGAATHFERFTEIAQLAQWAFKTYSWE